MKTNRGGEGEMNRRMECSEERIGEIVTGLAYSPQKYPRSLAQESGFLRFKFSEKHS
jgi:hypothetical protein